LREAALCALSFAAILISGLMRGAGLAFSPLASLVASIGSFAATLAARTVGTGGAAIFACAGRGALLRSGFEA
jgi:hypothetical protein